MSIWVSSWATRIPTLAIDAALKGFVLLAVAVLIASVLRKASAATRHLVWFLGLSGVLMMPLFSALLPGWNLLPAWSRAERVSSVFHSARSSRLNVSSETGNDVQASTHSRLLSKSTGSDINFNTAGGAVGNSITKTRRRISPTSIAVILWFLGFIFVAGSRTLGAVSLWVLRRRSEILTEGSWKDLLDKCKKELGVKDQITLLRNTTRQIPMTWGLLAPKILLPQEAAQWDIGHLRAAILHELAHIVRHDYFANVVGQAACSVHWFNPLVWYAARRMALERERACDDVVLNAGVAPPKYAEQVLSLAAGINAAQIESFAALPMARKSLLERRLVAIVDRHQSRASLTRGQWLAAVLFFAAGTMPLAMLSSSNANQQGSGAFLTGVSDDSLARRLAFSPVIERELSEGKGDQIPFLRFHNGEVLSTPFDSGGNPASPWMSRDVCFLRDEASGALKIWSKDCRFLPVDGMRWSTAPPEAVSRELDHAENSSSVLLPSSTGSPITCFFETAEKSMGVMRVTSLSEQAMVKIEYKLVGPIARRASGSKRVRSPLINVDFCYGEESPESGPAAVGRAAEDFWNSYNCFNATGAQRADGTSRLLRDSTGTQTKTWLSVSNAPGDWANGSDDIMYHGYMYDPHGKPTTVTVYSLPPGTYDFYIYSHDANDTISSAGIIYPQNGPARSFEYPVTNPVVWTEGQQYVLIRGVRVLEGQPVVLTAMPGKQGVAPLSGMQILKTD